MAVVAGNNFQAPPIGLTYGLVHLNLTYEQNTITISYILMQSVSLHCRCLAGHQIPVWLGLFGKFTASRIDHRHPPALELLICWTSLDHLFPQHKLMSYWTLVYASLTSTAFEPSHFTEEVVTNTYVASLLTANPRHFVIFWPINVEIHESVSQPFPRTSSLTYHFTLYPKTLSLHPLFDRILLRFAFSRKCHPQASILSTN